MPRVIRLPTKAFPGWEHAGTDDFTTLLPIQGVVSLGVTTPGYVNQFNTWAIWNNQRSSGGTTVLTDTGAGGTSPAAPALQIKTLSHAKTAINTFAIGNTFAISDTAPAAPLYDMRYDILRAI